MHDAAMEAFEVLSKVIKDGATTTEAEEAAEIIHRARLQHLRRSGSWRQPVSADLSDQNAQAA